MKSKNVLLAVIVAVFIVVIFYSVNDSQDETAYRKTILEEREQTDRFMRGEQSPFAANPEAYAGLKYFEPDPQYRIVAMLEPVDKKRVIFLPTSDGKEQQYTEYGYAEFSLGGERHRLLVYEGIGVGPMKGKLFVPFGDKTSAAETYGGGRYLDVTHTRGSATVVLDFNKAYNPYCAYNDTYSCPLPPPENLLNVPIRAGEKVYHASH